MAEAGTHEAPPARVPDAPPEADATPGDAARRGARYTRLYCALGGGLAFLVCWIFFRSFTSMKTATVALAVFGATVLASGIGLEVAALAARLRARIARRRGGLVDAACLEEFALAAAPRARRAEGLRAARAAAVARPDAAFEDHRGVVAAIAFDPGSALFATGGGDGRVVVRRATDAGEVGAVEFGSPVTALVFRPDGGALAVGTKAGKVHVLRPADGSSERVFEQSYPVVALAYDRYDALVSASAASGLVFLPRGESKPMATLRAGGDDVACAAFDARAERLVAGTSSGGVTVWDVRGDPLPLAQFGQGGRIRSVALSADGRLVGVFGGLGPAVWQVDPLQRIAAPEVDEDVSSLAFGPGAGTLLVAARTSVRILGMPKLEGLRHLEADAYRILVTDMSPDGRTVVAGTVDGKACFWRLAGE